MFRMCASNSHSYTHLILARGIVRKPTVWVFITSKYPGTHDIGLPRNIQYMFEPDCCSNPKPVRICWHCLVKFPRFEISKTCLGSDFSVVILSSSIGDRTYVLVDVFNAIISADEPPASQTAQTAIRTAPETSSGQFRFYGPGGALQLCICTTSIYS